MAEGVKPDAASGAALLPDDHAEALSTGALLRARLEPAIRRAGSQAAFAARAQIPKDSLSKYLSGSQPSPAVLIKMAGAAELTLDQLIGRSGKESDAGNGRAALATLDSGASLEGFMMVPRLEIRASAGPGRAVVPSEILAEPQIAVRDGWLRSLGIAPRNAEFLEATGDSMAPTICDGDLMLVDRGFGQVAHGKIYVLVVNGLVIVKRLQLLATGGLQLISDNERYPTETIRRDEVNNLSIEARVAWYGRAM